VLGAALVHGGRVPLPPARLYAPEARHEHFAGGFVRRGVVECVRTSQRGLPFRCSMSWNRLWPLTIGWCGPMRLGRCRVAVSNRYSQGRRIAPPYSRIAHADFGCKRYNRIGWRFRPGRRSRGPGRVRPRQCWRAVTDTLPVPRPRSPFPCRCVLIESGEIRVSNGFIERQR
jgi:hypothetical protein